jgi:hypothetical protein
MRRVFLYCFILACFIANSQAYYKNALIFDINTGIEIYNTSYSYKVKYSNTKQLDTTTTNKAGNYNLALGVEYGLRKHLGVGVRVKLNTYFTSKDTVTDTKPIVKSNDFMVFVNYHPLKMLPKFDLVLGGEMGFSSLNYKANDINNIILTGTGFYGSIYLNPRVYIKRFGFNLKLYAPFLSYTNLTTNNPNVNNYYTITKWQGDPSWGLSLGIQYRFLKIVPKV